tara:strand:+ start:110 stop:403 length:294 start_codon:yes stop_codon:yes gene_type:complete
MKKVKPTFTTVHWKSLDDPDKFRDADRIEEAQKIPLTDSQQVLIEEENKDLLEDQNSPEMKAVQKEVEELKAALARAKEDHQYDNLVHKRELEKMNK